LLGTYIEIRVVSIICCYTDTRRLYHVLRIRIICHPANTPELQTVRVVGGRKHCIEKFSALECFRVDAHAQDLLRRCNEHLYFVTELLQTETWIGQGDGRYLRNSAPAFFAHALLEQMCGQHWIPCSCGCFTWA